MTGRYTRRQVPFMEIRGLSRSVDVTPELERVDDSYEQYGDLSYISDKISASTDTISASSFAGDSNTSTNAGSGRSSPLIVEADNHSALSNGWATGNSTERSSVDSTFSWGDEEFDRHASKTVRQLFEEIDSMLYEEKQQGPETVYRECQEWSSAFPHFRLSGRQVMSPQDSGFQVYPMEVLQPLTVGLLQDISDTDISDQDTQSLAVIGERLHVQPIPTSLLINSCLSSDLDYLEEEIIEQDGYYEEVFAIDYRDIIDDRHERRGAKAHIPRRQRMGFPPITPNACLRDAIGAACSDCIWQEVLDCSKDLTKHYSQIILDEYKPYLHGGSPDRADPLSQDISYSLNNRLGRISDLPPLNELLTVCRKELVLREKSNLQDINEAPVTARAASVAAVKRPQRPASVVQREKERGLSASLRRSVPSGLRASQGVRLLPLAPHLLDRARTPSVEDARTQQMQNEVLIGHRVPLSNDRLVSPGLQPSPCLGSRNSTLPPLDVRRGAHYRAASALVTDKESSRLSYKERYMQTQEALARPSTTHTFRSDTPSGFPAATQINRRSSTPLGIYALTTKPALSLAGAGSYLGVTGNSLARHTDLISASPDEDDDDEMDDTYDDVIHTQWTPMTAAPRNNPYSRGKQLSSSVRV